MHFKKWLLALAATVVLSSSIPGELRAASATTLYATGFEAAEGFNTGIDLVGQKGWQGFGTQAGDNNTGFIPDDIGHMAYLGFTPPSDNGDSVTIWRPITFDAVAEGKPIVTFRVIMGVIDSTTENYDEFRWSIYNDQGQRLFSLIFDNHTLDIDYLLDETNPEFRSTGFSFDPDTFYELEIGMDFARNKWSARLNSSAVVVDAAITTRGQALTFGDADAVWIIRNPDTPGDNFLLFDDILITAEPDFVPPPLIELLSVLSDGSAVLRLHGEPEIKYIIEGTTNFANWLPLKTNIMSDEIFDFIDSSSGPLNRRFYRARIAE